MARQFDDSAFDSSRPDSGRPDFFRPTTISFVQKLAASENFKTLFREGMALVEESAGYLDGAGRDEARQLRRAAAMAYTLRVTRAVHRTLPETPAMEAGIAEHVWSIDEIVGILS